MKNPFKAYQEYVKKTPRNSFDLSHSNNLTLPFGLLVPNLVLDVTAGDSASIDAAFAFNFYPMVFPIQTPVRINQYFFYVRYRNTMENYKEMRYGNKTDIVHPYLKQPASFFKTCSLADYMGIPTTLAVGEHGYLLYQLDGEAFHGLRHLFPARFQLSSGSSAGGPIFKTGPSFSGITQAFSAAGAVSASSSTRAYSYFFAKAFSDQLDVDKPVSAFFYLEPLNPGLVRTSELCFTFCVKGLDMPLYSNSDKCELSVKFYANSAFLSDLTTVLVLAANPRTGLLLTTFYECECAYDSSTHVLTFDIGPCVDEFNHLLGTIDGSYDIYVTLKDTYYGKYSSLDTFVLDHGVSVPIVASRPIDIGEHPELNPFCSVNGEDPLLRINALPFRAYEQVYNAYFRNERIEPFMKNGEVEYNDFGTTYADGADTTPYVLEHRNWEMDMLTSCLKTPQQGTAPIVGVDARRITFSDGDSNYNFVYQTDSDGRLVSEGAHFEEENVPGSVRNAAIDLVVNGFTIENLREANAMTLWVEKNIRRGLRYRDQLKAHTGIDLDYDELELPEFLGGFSEYVDVSTITATAESGTVLGDIAGKAGVFKKANHTISHFFREDGVVLGLCCIVPQPVYSQMLPKFYLRTSALDYYNAEFSHLGMQPVPYAEVAPVQMYDEMNHGGERTMQTPFGYNRPNYDMVSMSDEVHGLMRTTDRDFVLMRTFDGVPELGASFLHVDGDQLNNVFNVQDPTDQVARGQVAFKIFMKRPFPSVGEPRLE